jgi:hypothetical protein
MERILVLLDEARTALGSTDAPPCDDEGAPH